LQPTKEEPTVITNHLSDAATPSKRGWRRLVTCLTLALSATAALSLAASSAGARGLGHVAPPGAGGCTNCQALALHTAPSSPSYVVPHGRWKVTSWSVRGHAIDDAAARLLVYRRTSTPGAYRLLAESRKRKVAAGSAPTFSSSIRVRRGDRLGIQGIGHIPVRYDSTLQDQIGVFTCYPGPGQIVGTGTACPLDISGGGARINVAATIKRR
jgi:hypothetical protein